MTELTYTEEVVPIEKLKEDDEFKTLVPSNNSREDLEKSLREKSQIFPLIADRNYVLIDGYTRLDIMKKLGFKEVKILKYDLDSQQERDKAYELIWMFNGVRRQLDKSERLALFQKIADRIAKIQASKNKTEESKIVSHADSVVVKLQILGLTFSPIRLGLWSTSWCECSYLLP
jgi:ParB-like chromosome segregation protein Spo0J